MTVCILTDFRGFSQNEHQWIIGEPSATVTYYYPDEYVAVFANPFHEKLDPLTMKLWEFKSDKEIERDALRCCCISGTVIRSIPIPSMSLCQRVAIAKKCVLMVLSKGEFSVLRKEEFERFKEWAENKNRMVGIADYNGIRAAGTLGKPACDGVGKVVQAAALCFSANELLHCSSLSDWANQMAVAAKFLAASSVASIAKDTSGGKYLNVPEIIKSIMAS